MWHEAAAWTEKSSTERGSTVTSKRQFLERLAARSELPLRLCRRPQAGPVTAVTGVPPANTGDRMVVTVFESRRWRRRAAGGPAECPVLSPGHGVNTERVWVNRHRLVAAFRAI